MPSVIANAIGTQRQFTKQPASTYQKQIKPVSSSAGIRTAGKGRQLAEALNGLGASVLQYGQDTENRKRTMAAKATQIVNAATDEDWKTLASIDLLHKYGEFQLADNPYAVAVIEQNRGKYFSDKFNQQYSLLVSEQGRMKTAQEETARYEQEKAKFLQDNMDATFDAENFHKGFFASNPQDILDNANAQVAQQSNDLKAVRDGSIMAETGDAIRNNYEKDPEHLLGALQTISKESMATGYSPSQKIAWGKDMLNEVSSYYGSPDLIKKLSGSLVIGAKDDGSPMLLGELIDTTPYIQAAEAVNKQAPSKWTLEQEEAMIRAKDLTALDTLWAGYTPDQQRLMHGSYRRTRDTLVAEEEKAKKELAKQAAKKAKAAVDAQRARVDYQRYVHGQSAATTATQLGLDSEAIPEALQPEWEKINAMPDSDERTLELSKLISYGPNSIMRNSLKQKYEYTLSTLSAKDMLNDSSAQGVMTALNLYQANPSLFTASFGGELAGSMAALKTLRTVSGDTERAFQLYCTGRDNMKDPTVKAQTEAFAKSFTDSESVPLYSLDTGGNVPIPFRTNRNLIGAAGKYMAYATAAGLSTVNAQKALNSSLRENYVEYNDEVLPKVFFDAALYNDDGTLKLEGITSDTPYDTAKAYMDSAKANTPQGYDTSNLKWIYDPAQETIQLISTDYSFAGKKMTLQEFREEVNRTMQEKYDEQVEARKKQPVITPKYDMETIIDNTDIID